MTHTKESLEALPERELDALAHETVFGEKPEEKEITYMDFISYTKKELMVNRPKRDILPCYSTSLDAAALLEVGLDKGNLDDKYADVLFQVVIGTGATYLAVRHYECGYTIGCAAIWAIAHATAKARTVAAILAVQGAA